MTTDDGVLLETSEQCEFYAAVAGSLTLGEAQKYVPADLVVTDEEGEAFEEGRAA